ncbi:hypothetical protein [Chondromyces crocatus]|nr:hypothetical protein [Chondromyces crocatus]
MMRRFVKGLCSVLAALSGCAVLMATSPAEAQEIQLTGPLAGAPAVRKLRLYREGRVELSPSVSFSLLDEYQRTIMPGLRATYHFTDWLGVGVWGGFGFQYTTNLTDELQEKAVNARDCANREFTKACRLTAGNLTRGNLAEDQLGRMQWIAAPQLTFVPFRGKLALFAELFVDTDVNIFVGPAFVGLQERRECGSSGTPCSNPESFSLESRLAIAPTFGLGINFYPTNFFGFGVEYRGLPFSWNTSGFDNYGGGPNGDFPDTAVNSEDRQFFFNSLLTLNLTFFLPTKVKIQD